MNVNALSTERNKPPRGRPVGATAPLTRWLREVVRGMKRENVGCMDAWRRLCLVEDADADWKALSISEETASECWRDIDDDIAGARLTLVGFRKAWQRTR